VVVVGVELGVRTFNGVVLRSGDFIGYGYDEEEPVPNFG